MSLDPISKLRAEADRLRLLISDSQKRLDEIAELIRLLQKYDSVIEQGPVSAGTLAMSALDLMVRRQQQKRRQPTQKERITNACEMILSDGRRRRTRELLAELQHRGIDIPGLDPPTNLASYLSRDPRFESKKGLGGWTLVLFLQNEKPGSAPTLPGLFTFGASEEGHTQAAGSDAAGGDELG